MLTQTLSFGLFVFCMEVTFIIHQTDFGVDNNISPFWQMHNHVWVATFTRIIFQGNLGIVFATIGQARIFEQLL